MRAPVVAGVGGGVGTTTVAVGLRGHDAGRLTGPPPGHRPDILVCRATFDSLQRAAAVLAEADPAPPPVLAVTLPGTRPPHGPLRAWLERLEADTAGLVLLPHVRRWGVLIDPLAEAAQLLVEPTAQLPRPLRAYAAALRELAGAVANSGRLGRGPDDRHPRRPGSAGRAVDHNSVPMPAAVAAAAGFGRGPGNGLGPPAARSAAACGAGPAGLLPTSPAPEPSRVHGPSKVDPARTDPTPPGPERRRGVRIVSPDGLRPAAEGAARSARRVAPGAEPVIREAATAGAGDRRPGRTDADVAAERVR